MRAQTSKVHLPLYRLYSRIQMKRDQSVELIATSVSITDSLGSDTTSTMIQNVRETATSLTKSYELSNLNVSGHLALFYSNV